ncbi:caspase family protein [Actinokineospora globicatena]|uniref:caspase family protein n=1 Tax=Actinokineospora globicatena TaxID=103729 RepID=UPI0020A2F3B9|nr:caspase family protein [Actinokineospora globicatena]MCP2306269.1 Caspase domain-containing protein [Actinokineospora globicatena]GLW81693.1 hypothetical protein Aglo01_61740 [Actinokineospora globicatena]GLW88488.1 hypothetical protein Aglo02_61270 [Actinokineospora globicatena]
MARLALLVANRTYADPGLRALRAPEHDARELAAVLADPAIGDFAVTTELDLTAGATSEAVEDFFADRAHEDLLLLYFSGHGIKDPAGDLHFATAGTRLDRLGSTAVSAEFVRRQMDRTRARQVVLLLDCCYAGAFHRGMVARAGDQVGVEERFRGRGRAVITASSAMEYAFEGKVLTDSTAGEPSVFTAALVEGLRSGDADRDQDGVVGLDELYDHVYDRVRAATPHQTPGKWVFDLRGDLRIARRARPVTVPSELPEQLRDAMGHLLVSVREGVVKDLERLLTAGHEGRALAARLALADLAADDSRRVVAAATEVLKAHSPAPIPTPTPTPVPASSSGEPRVDQQTAVAEPSDEVDEEVEQPHRSDSADTPVISGDTTSTSSVPLVTVRLARLWSAVALAVAAVVALVAAAPTQMVVVSPELAEWVIATPFALVLTSAATWLLVVALIAVVVRPWERRNLAPAVGLPLAMVGLAYAAKVATAVAMGRASQYASTTLYVVGLLLAVGCLALNGSASSRLTGLGRAHVVAVAACGALVVDLFVPNAYSKDPQWLIPIGVGVVLLLGFAIADIARSYGEGKPIVVDLLFPLLLLGDLGYTSLSRPSTSNTAMYIAFVVIGLTTQVCLTGRALTIARIGVVAAVLIHMPPVTSVDIATYVNIAFGLTAIGLALWGDAVASSDIEEPARSM